MKKSRRSPSNSKRRANRPTDEDGESRAVETVTVIWVLTILNTFACELGALAVGSYARAHADAAAAKLLSELLLLAAVIVGVISLGLLPVILKIRRNGPPPAVTVFAIVVGLAPILALVLKAL